MRSPTRSALLLPLLPLLALLAAACSATGSGVDGGSIPCNENPWECTSEQTCWPTSSSSYECLIAGPGKLGGTCVAYCSTTVAGHGCPGGQVCATAELGGTGGPEFSVCVAEQVGGSDAGT